MARKRMITPTIWGDPSFNRLSHSARLLVIGMISHADDEGRERGDAGSLRRLVFGFDELPENLSVSNLLKELQKHMGRTVHLYEINGEKYYHFVNWSRYQKQQKDRVQASEYPPCSTCVAPAKQMLTEVKLSKVKLSKDNSLRSSDAKASRVGIKKGLVVFTEPLEAEPDPVNSIIELFKPINPTYTRLFPQKAQRGAINRLIKTFGVEEVERLIRALPAVVGAKYAPIITTPLQLESKMGQLAAFIKSHGPGQSNTAFAEKTSFHE